MAKKWLVQVAMNFSRQKAQKAQNRNAFYVLQCVRIIHFHEDFTTDNTDGTDGSCAVRVNSQSVKSVKSVVQFLWLRRAALGLLSFFAASHYKSLSMSNLRAKRGFPNQVQSRLIKPNQVIF
jgi:hypothetical protein